VPCLVGGCLGKASTSGVGDAEDGLVISDARGRARAGARARARAGAGNFATHFATTFNASTTA
jgi:hypothetical protein